MLYIWMFGLSITQCLYRLVLMGAFGDIELRRNIDRFWAAGFEQFQFQRTLVTVVLPFLYCAMMVVCPPFAFSRGVVPLFTSDPWLQWRIFS